jgi:hypothetical protein
MKFTVGGEEYDLTRERIERVMRNVAPEPIQKYLVEMLGQVFPPKQVFAQVTGRTRTSFTTQEAQRVLLKLGFVCREAGGTSGDPAWLQSAVHDDDYRQVEPDRLAKLESGLATAHLAIAELQRRVTSLEDGGS